MGRDNYQYLPLTEGLFDELTSGEPEAYQYTEIRQRIWHTISNGSLLWLKIPPKERKNLFDVEAKGRNSGMSDEDYHKLGYKDFHEGLKWWLAFLYAGIDEAPHAYELDLGTVVPEVDKGSDSPLIRHPTARFDFEYILQEAVEAVANSRGERVTTFEFSVETEPIEPPERPSFDTEELLEKFEQGEPLSSDEHLYLRRETSITTEQWEEYFDRFDDRIEDKNEGGQKSGWMSPDEALERAEQAGEEKEPENTDNDE